MITENDYNKAVGIIREFKKQIDEERQESFKQRLSEFDKTYWFYKGRTSITYVSFIVKEHGYDVTRFIVHTNGIIEIKFDSKRKEDLEYYLSEMGEYAPDEFELQEGRKGFIFKEMTQTQFIYDLQPILSKLKISNSHFLTIKEKGRNALKSSLYTNSRELKPDTLYEVTRDYHREGSLLGYDLKKGELVKLGITFGEFVRVIRQNPKHFPNHLVIMPLKDARKILRNPNV